MCITHVEYDMCAYRRQKGVHHHRALSMRPSNAVWRRRTPVDTEVNCSAYVVQIDSSRESLYLMWLPNGVRLKRCSHHRRKSSPGRRHVDNWLFRTLRYCRAVRSARQLLFAYVCKNVIITITVIKPNNKRWSYCNFFMDCTIFFRIIF